MSSLHPIELDIAEQRYLGLDLPLVYSHHKILVLEEKLTPEQEIKFFQDVYGKDAIVPSRRLLAWKWKKEDWKKPRKIADAIIKDETRKFKGSNSDAKYYTLSSNPTKHKKAFINNTLWTWKEAETAFRNCRIALSDLIEWFGEETANKIARKVKKNEKANNTRQLRVKKSALKI